MPRASIGTGADGQTDSRRLGAAAFAGALFAAPPPPCRAGAPDALSRRRSARFGVVPYRRVPTGTQRRRAGAAAVKLRVFGPEGAVRIGNMDAARCSAKKPWWPSAEPAIGRMEFKHGADPTCSICSPQLTGAMYPHFIRQQRTSLDILRNRKHIGTPGPGAYDVDMGYQACLPSSPSITIQGVRRPKRHETGPFTTL